MKPVTKLMLESAVKIVRLNEPETQRLSGDKILQQIDIYLGSRLPVDLLGILAEFGDKVNEQTKLSALLNKARTRVFADLRVKRFKNGEYSILNDSPLKYDIEEHTMKTETQQTTPAASSSRRKAAPKRKTTAKKTTAKKTTAKKTTAKKTTAKKTTAKKTTNSRIKHYQLKLKVADMKKIKETIAPQAYAILECLQKKGKVERADLLACMEKKVTSRQPMGVLLAFYQKKLAALGAIELS